MGDHGAGLPRLHGLALQTSSQDGGRRLSLEVGHSMSAQNGRLRPGMIGCAEGHGGVKVPAAPGMAAPSW